MGLERPVILDPQERQAARDFFAGDVFRKILHNARLSKPSLFDLRFDGTATGQSLMAIRVAQQQGWRMFEVALAQEVEMPNAKRIQPKDNFPDEGRDDFQPKKKS